jgi:eukaryotic-like serine/threonine-protein kinase
MAEPPAATSPLSTLSPTGSPGTQEVPVPSTTRYGRFALQRLHAQGGLGEVHVAVDAELGRNVAIKRIQDRFVHNAAAKRRFLNEAEITAKLEHPGIVPIYGLVQDEQGQPCYAMRFIAGESLADAIKKWHEAGPNYTALPFRQLLQRFISICQTMAYAHSKEIIHRDLKPANVMLGPYGETLIVDWGLAKSASGGPASKVDSQELMVHEGTGPLSATVDFQPTADDRVMTQTGQVLGTAGYMSPEQAAGQVDVVGPASDIYSLGATLYELLTGQRPLGGSDIFTALHKTQAGEIPAPRQVRPTVPRALEAVCRKAMALKPENRYASATALAADLEQWLADEPVSAYAEPWTTRARRWMRRHRTLATGLAVTLVAAVLVLLVATVLLEQARQRVADEQQRTELAFSKAKEAVDLFYKEVAEDPVLKGTPGLHRLRKRLLEVAVPFFQWFTEQKPTRLQWRVDQGWAYGRLANILDDLGEHAQALPHLQRHREICAQLVAEQPQNPAYRSDFSGALHNLARERAHQKAFPEAQRLYEEALAHAEWTVQAEPANPRYRQYLANHYDNLGTLLADMGRQPEAVVACRRALALQEQLVADFPTVPEYRRLLAIGHHSLGTILAELGQQSEAQAAYARALDRLEKLVADFPAEPESRQALGRCLHSLGVLLVGLGQQPAAVPAHRRALVILEKLVVDFSTVPGYRQDLARCHHSLGNVLSDLGQGSAAEAAYRKAVELNEKLIDDFPAVPEYRHDLASCLHNLGALLADLEQRPAALAAYRRALAFQERLVTDFPAVPEYRQELARSHYSLGMLQKNLRQWAAAQDAYRRALELLEKLVTDFPHVPDYRQQLAHGHQSMGLLQRTLGQRPAAQASYRRALALQEKLVADFPAVPEYRRDFARSHNNLGNQLTDLKLSPEAETSYRRALDLQEKLVADFPAMPVYCLELAGSCVNFGMLIRDQGQTEASQPWFTKAIALLEPRVRQEPRLITERLFLRNAHWGRAIALDRLGFAAEALPDWDRAWELKAEDGDTPGFRLERALALARAGRHAQAVAEAQALAEATDTEGKALYDLARVCSFAANSVKENDTLRDQYAARAVALLRQAIAKGYKNLEHLKKDEDLKALQQREDFQKLLQELEKTKP